MVLRSSIAIPTLALAALGALATGCKEQSLFDEGKEQEGPGTVGTSCPAQCLGDAARDFDGTAGGAGDHWRYLDDNRNRTWTAMSPYGAGMLGSNPATVLSVCAPKSTSPACVALPGALLLSTAGSSSSADPAIEFKVDAKRVVQIGLRAFVPETENLLQILVYRNSREDLLYAGPLLPGDLFERSIDVDVIPNDRLIVALAPSGATGGGAAEVGLELFLSDTGKTSKCQVALDFEQAQATGNTITAHCGAPFTHYLYEPDNTPMPPVLADGPYPELGKAASIATNTYYKGTDVLDKGEEFTWQYWMHINALDPVYDVWVVSDLDLNTYGGIGNGVYQRATINFDTQIANETEYLGANTEFAHVNKWVFVRVSYANGKLSTCFNGKRVTSFDIPVAKLKSNFPLYLGKNVVWLSQVAVYNGLLDDVRVLSTALPCE